MLYIVNRCNLEDQRENLTELFAKLDKNGDQHISKSELREGLKEGDIILSDKEFEDLFKKLDSDNSGSITYSEFLAGAVGISMLNNELLLQEAFNFMDKDHKG